MIGIPSGWEEIAAASMSAFDPQAKRIEWVCFATSGAEQYSDEYIWHDWRIHPQTEC